MRGWGTVGGGAGVFRGAVLPGPPATLSSATQCVLLPLPPLLLLWVRARALALGPFASLHVPCPLSRSLCVSPLSEWGSPSFDPPWVHVMVKCAKRPAPVLAHSVGSYEAAGICPLPWAPAWESLPPPPRFIPTSCLCSQAWLGTAPWRCPPGAEPGDSGSWGVGTEHGLGARRLRSPWLPGWWL